MRELVVLWAGRHQRSNWEEICASYRKRIARLATVRDVPVRARAAPDDPQRMKAEGAALLAALPPSAWAFALDSRGETLSSEQFAARLARFQAGGPHPAALLTGSVPRPHP